MIACVALLVTACSSADIKPDRSAVLTAEKEIVAPTLFVANKRGNTLSKIDLKTGEEILRIDSCANPHELATSPDGKHVALACYGGRMIEIFRTGDLGLAARVQLGEGARPHGIVWTSSGTIYATAEGRESIYRIVDPLDTVQTSEFKTNQRGSHMLAVAPDEKTAWTTDLGSKTVTKVDLTGKGERLSVTVGEEPEGIDLSPDGETLWVSARGSDEVFLLDPDKMTVRKKLKAGSFPLRLTISPDGRYAVTSDLGNGGLTVYETEAGEPVRYIMVGGPEKAQERLQVTILWSDDGERIYVAETGTDTIAEVDFVSGEMLRRLKTGKGGDGLAILP